MRKAVLATPGNETRALTQAPARLLRVRGDEQFLALFARCQHFLGQRAAPVSPSGRGAA
jgi:hypothetical protein